MEAVRALALVGLVVAAWMSPLIIVFVALRIRALIAMGRLPAADADLFPRGYFQVWNVFKRWSPRVDALEDPELRSLLRLYRRLMVVLLVVIALAITLAIGLQAKS